MIEVAVVKPICTSLNAAEWCLVSKEQDQLSHLLTMHLTFFLHLVDFGLAEAFHVVQVPFVAVS